MPLLTLVRIELCSMSSASLAWTSTAMPLSARFRASLDEAYTILDCERVSYAIIKGTGSWNYLNSGIIRRPSDEG
jgi:hypothetical protein